MKKFLTPKVIKSLVALLIALLAVAGIDMSANESEIVNLVLGLLAL